MNLGYLRQAITHQSLGQVISHYAYRSIQRLFDVSIFRCLLVQDRTVIRNPVPSGTDCRFVTADRLRQEAAVTGSGLDAEEVERLLKSGEECFGAFVDGVLASYLWFSPGPAHLIDDVFVRFDPAYAYSRWAFTRSEYRGKQLHAICKQSALDEFTARGRLGIISVVYAWNSHSLSAAAKLGCVRVGLLGIVWGKLWTSKNCRRVGLSLERSPNGKIPMMKSRR